MFYLLQRILLNRFGFFSYYLTVSAADKDNLASSATVIITVEDVNDDPPSFTRLFSATVKENAAVGDYVIQVNAIAKVFLVVVIEWCHHYILIFNVMTIASKLFR